VGAGAGYAALAFDGGTLYGDNLVPGNGAGGGTTHLVTIDPTTGIVSDIGPSVTRLDALAVAVPEPGAMTLLVGSGVISLLTRRRR
jgi:hypothetical protein